MTKRTAFYQVNGIAMPPMTVLQPLYHLLDFFCHGQIETWTDAVA